MIMNKKTGDINPLFSHFLPTKAKSTVSLTNETLTYTFILLKIKWFYPYQKAQMPIMKKINQTDLWEIRDHRDNTSKDLVKAYTLTQLSFMDGIDTRTVKTSWKYLPIRVDVAGSLSQFKAGKQKKPYMTLRIRLDEIKLLFNKRTGKKLTIE